MTAEDIAAAGATLEAVKIEELTDRFYAEGVAREQAEARRAAENYKGTEEISWDDLFTVPMEWLVEDLLPARSAAFLVAKPNMGKTFVYLDMALNLALGRPWLGKHTKASRVLFVLGEGRAGFGARLRAWAVSNNVDPEALKPQVAFIDGANLNNDVSLARIADVARRHGADLIVFDTYAASSGVQSEDDSALNARTLNRAASIRPEATRLFVHHPTKSTEDTHCPVLRGSGALAGSVDVVMTLWRDKSYKPASGGSEDYLALSTENDHGGKNRNARTETWHGLYLAPCDDSMVVMRDLSATLSKADQAVLEHLLDGMTIDAFSAAASLPRTTASRYLTGSTYAVRTTDKAPHRYALMNT